MQLQAIGMLVRYHGETNVVTQSGVDRRNFYTAADRHLDPLDAKAWMALLLLDGEHGQPADPKAARKLLDEAVKAGSPGGLFVAGMIAENGELDYPNGMAQARELYREAADKGHAGAARKLIDFTLKGIGGPKDIVTAERLLQRLADEGDNGAKTELGVLDLRGSFGAPNTDKDVALIRAAATATPPNAVAMNELGLIYYRRLGVRRDLDQARSWFERGVQAGSDGAMVNLGVMYQTGVGVEKDLDRGDSCSSSRRTDTMGSRCFTLAICTNTGSARPRT